MCNGFSISGEAAGGGHYFGRDFMFPTAGVFNDVAAMVIYSPSSENGNQSHPFICLTAPGIIGSITAINSKGVAMGVDMLPAANCNYHNPGFNSLLLARHIIQHSDTIDKALDLITDAERGVSWIYIIADGKDDRSCIVETGKKDSNPDYTKHLPDKMKKYLPDNNYLRQYPSGADLRKGLGIRWNNFSYPTTSYSGFNQKIWTDYLKKPYPSNSFSPTGYLCKMIDPPGTSDGIEKNVPIIIFRRSAIIGKMYS